MVWNLSMGPKLQSRIWIVRLSKTVVVILDWHVERSHILQCLLHGQQIPGPKPGSWKLCDIRRYILQTERHAAAWKVHEQVH